MDFSVIVCTYNRANLLPRCLNALARQRGVDGLNWEVLVVDNNSTDNTRSTVASLATELPINIRYSWEGQQGLNHARNTGIRETQSTYFAYVDDDIAVSPFWLQSLHQRFVKDDADAVGGRIHLDPSIALPRWIKDDDTKGFLGYQDYGDQPFRMDGKKRYPFGGNMAFNRRVVDRIGYFNPMLGRKGEGRKRSELFKGAETDYFHRMSTKYDARIFYEPNAVVYHHVQPFQLKKRYFITIHSNAGYDRAYNDDREYERTVFGVPRYLYAMLASNVFTYMRQLIGYGPDHAFRQKMNIGYTLGSMLGYYRRHRRTHA